MPRHCIALNRLGSTKLGPVAACAAGALAVAALAAGGAFGAAAKAEAATAKTAAATSRRDVEFITSPQDRMAAMLQTAAETGTSKFCGRSARPQPQLPAGKSPPSISRCSHLLPLAPFPSARGFAGEIAQRNSSNLSATPVTEPQDIVGHRSRGPVYRVVVFTATHPPSPPFCLSRREKFGEAGARFSAAGRRENRNATARTAPQPAILGNDQILQNQRHAVNRR